MTEWAMLHPWMTFFIVLAGLEVAGRLFAVIVVTLSQRK